MLDNKLPLDAKQDDVHETEEFIKRCSKFEHKMLDCVATTAGGVEEDLIECLAPTYMGAFDLSGRELRERGINPIRNLLVPNDNYCKFEDWLTPLLEEMLEEQKSTGTV